MRAFFLVVVVAVAVAACSASPQVVSDREAAEIANNGINQTGLDLSIDEWRAIGEQACEGEAWVEDNARRLGNDLSQQYQPPDPTAMPTVVWMAAVTACRERIPDEAIRNGPPVD